MTTSSMPAVQNLLAKEGSSFTIPRERHSSKDSIVGGGSSDSESDSFSNFDRTRRRVVKETMPSITTTNSGDEPTFAERETSNILLKSNEKSHITKVSRSDIGLALQNSSSRPIKVIVVSDLVRASTFLPLFAY
jgi:hypothetical protein